MTTLQVNNIGTMETEIELPDELSVLEDGATPKVGYGCFRIMTKEDGDKRVVWRKESIPEINAAKDMFVKLVEQGMQPYRVGEDGQASAEIMREFDPSAEEVIFLPLQAVRAG